jgi:hypothetical protein
MKVYQKERYIHILINYLEDVSFEMLADLSTANKNAAIIVTDSSDQIRIYDPQLLINHNNFDKLFDKEM